MRGGYLSSGRLSSLLTKKHCGLSSHGVFFALKNNIRSTLLFNHAHHQTTHIYQKRTSKCQPSRLTKAFSSSSIACAYSLRCLSLRLKLRFLYALYLLFPKAIFSSSKACALPSSFLYISIIS